MKNFPLGKFFIEKVNYPTLAYRGAYPKLRLLSTIDELLHSCGIAKSYKATHFFAVFVKDQCGNRGDLELRSDFLSAINVELANDSRSFDVFSNFF
jgi:hypothetical protein